MFHLFVTATKETFSDDVHRKVSVCKPVIIYLSL
jgi:hypothetical protein